MFGRLTSVGTFWLLYSLILSGKPEFLLYNKINYEVNIVLILLFAFSYLIFLGKLNRKYKKLLFIVFAVIQLHFFASMLADINERSSDVYDSNDMSSLFIIPCCIIYIFIWGWHFDKKYRFGLSNSPAMSSRKIQSKETWRGGKQQIN
jgi:succinate-acetate transporter protein